MDAETLHKKIFNADILSPEYTSSVKVHKEAINGNAANNLRKVYKYDKNFCTPLQLTTKMFFSYLMNLSNYGFDN